MEFSFLSHSDLGLFPFGHSMYSILVLFHFGLIPIWFYSIIWSHSIFSPIFGLIPFFSDSNLVLFQFGLILFYSYSDLVSFHLNIIPF